MPPSVPLAFFSYSREDSDFALKLASDLKTAGANVWIDRLDIKPGQWWDKSVEEALNQCPRMLVILSPASVNSKNVLDEVSFALEEQKTVLPVLYRECHIPFRLRRVQYLDFTKNYDSALPRLIEALAAIPVPTTDVIQAAMVKEALVADQARQQQESLPSAESKTAAPSQADEFERRRIAAEPAQLDEEHKQAATEQARLDQAARKAAEEKSRQAEADRQAIVAEQARLEEERQRLAAEQARLDEERQQAAAQKASLLKLEQERQAAVEKARQDDKRKQAAAAKARREQAERERQAAAEQARLDEQKLRADAANQAQRDADESARLSARRTRETEELTRAAPAAATYSDSPSFSSVDTTLVSGSSSNSLLKPVGIGLAVLLVIGLIVLVVWQRSNEADERAAYARSLAEEHARAEQAQQPAANQPTSPATASGSDSLSTAYTSPFDGTWKVDTASFRSNQIVEFLLQNGHWGGGSTPFNADGTMQKVAHNHFIDQFSISVLDDHNVMEMDYQNGKLVNSYKYSVSSDGGTLTSTAVDYTSTVGGPINSTHVYSRVSYGPSGSHALSGKWRYERLQEISESALIGTFKTTAAGFSYSNPTGTSYTASFNGPDSALSGDNRYTNVSLKRLSDSSFQETDKRNGKTIDVTTFTLSADGQKLTARDQDKEGGRTVDYVAYRTH